jgi:RNA polymerase sigma-70 factor (ECF subfamily)
MPDARTVVPKLNERDYHQLFIENQRRIYSFIRTLLPDFNDAQDVFQNVCVVVLGKADQFVPGTDLCKWACQIAYFEVCNYRRRKQKESTGFSAEALELLRAEQLQRWDEIDARYEALMNCLAKLQPRDRKLLDARYRCNVALRELAAELARPVATIKKVLRRIRRDLQQCIERTLAREERGG